MKRIRKNSGSTRRKMRRTATLLAAAVAPGLMAAAADAIIIIGGSQAHFGPLGLTKGDTARLSIAANPPDGERPCDVEVTFYDARGGVVGASRLNVSPGESRFADVSFDQVTSNPPDGDKRRTLRATAVLVNPPDPDAPACVATLEVFDRTGKTQIILGGPDTLPSPRR
jgi:hypothetical protein